MSAWLDGPVAGPLVDGDLCEMGGGYRCEEPAVVIGQLPDGAERLVCGWHAERHGLSVPGEEVVESGFGSEWEAGYEEAMRRVVAVLRRHSPDGLSVLEACL